MENSSTIEFHEESENSKLAKNLLNGFINCAFEEVSDDIEIKALREFIKSMGWQEKFAEFFSVAEEYFFLNYDSQEAEGKYQQFLDFATKHGLVQE